MQVTADGAKSKERMTHHGNFMGGGEGQWVRDPRQEQIIKPQKIKHYN